MGTIGKLMGLIGARLRRRRYEQIVPLGVNCEVAFRFYRSWGFVDSSIAAWAQLYDLDTTVGMLGRLGDVMTGEAEFDAAAKMWKCLNTGVKFHGKLKYGERDTPEQIAADLADLRQRVAHLKEKLISYAANERETLFIHRLSEKDERESDRLAQRLNALEAAIMALGAKNWRLLVICERKFLMAMPAGGKRIYRAVEKFNPHDQVTNAELGDKLGWRAIFTEFAPATVQKKRHGFKFE